MAERGSSTSRPRFVGGQGGARPTGEKAKDRRGTLRRLSDYLKPYHGRLILVAALVVVGTLLGLLGPALLGRAIDQYVIFNDIDGLAAVVLVMLLVYLGQGIFTAIHGVIMIPRGPTFCGGYTRGALPPFSSAIHGLPRPPSRRRSDEPHFK